MSRTEALRAQLAAIGVDGFLVPRVDRHRGEFTQAADDRLAWLTGFTGSAGLAIVLADRAALFVDGRYELQAGEEVDGTLYEVVKTKGAPNVVETWLKGAAQNANAPLRLSYDPWLHTIGGLDTIERALEGTTLSLTPTADNPIDAIWSDRPTRPTAPARIHPEAVAGESSAEKRARLAETLAAETLDAAVLTLPDAINWLLNLRGSDLPHTPVLLAFAILQRDASVRLFTDPAKITPEIAAHLGDGVSTHAWDAFEPALDAMAGQRVAVVKGVAPAAIPRRLEAAGAEVVWRSDSVANAKARKNTAEIAGARAAHLRDGAAMVAFLRWLETAVAAGGCDELAAGRKLREIRATTGERLGWPLIDESFAPIVGFGPNGAIVHYHANPDSNQTIAPNGVLLVDSGGQYGDGTTDITRTLAVGEPPRAAVEAVTRVLQGMIAISTLRFPPKTEGRHLDAFARLALWRAGFDYDHGTGHGVGSCLGVHEAPPSLSQRGGAALEPGMILSNEPGCYVQDAFGIRIENLILVREPETPPGGARAMLSFETLTFVPIDRRLIEPAWLSTEERIWIDDYHAEVLAKLAPLLADDAERAWLAAACAPL